MSLKPGNKGTCELNKHQVTPVAEDNKLVDQTGVSFSLFLKVSSN